jgi:hypothetical protein
MVNRANKEMDAVRQATGLFLNLKTFLIKIRISLRQAPIYRFLSPQDRIFTTTLSDRNIIKYCQPVNYDVSQIRLPGFQLQIHFH